MTLEQKEQAYITLVAAIIPKFLTPDRIDMLSEYKSNKLFGQLDALESKICDQTTSIAITLMDKMDEALLIDDPERIKEAGA